MKERFHSCILEDPNGPDLKKEIYGRSKENTKGMEFLHQKPACMSALKHDRTPKRTGNRSGL